MTEPMPPMQYRTLGRTGLRVSLASLGSGGARRLGQATGATEREMFALIHHALELGINFIDTSPAYQESEALIGKALSGGRRGQALLCTKFAPSDQGQLVDASAIRQSVER